MEAGSGGQRTSPESLLGTHHDERHAVAARALKHTMAQTELQRRDERIIALVDVVSELASMDEPANGSPESSPGWTLTTTSERLERLLLPSSERFERLLLPR